MKLWTSEKLTKDCYDNWIVGSGNPALCVEELAEWFDIPEGTAGLWVVVHDKPAPDRVEILRAGWARLRCGPGERKDFPEVYSWAADNVVRLLSLNHDRPIYVEIQYEVAT